MIGPFQSVGVFLGAIVFMLGVMTSSPSLKDDGAKVFEIAYPALHPGAQKVWDEANDHLARNGNCGRFFVCAHRGWNKTSFALRRILLFVKETGLPAAWYAPTQKPIADAWENLFKKALGTENFDAWMNRSDGILRIPGCGSIHFYSLVEANNAAGPTYPFCVIDETGSLQDGVFESIIEPILEKALVSYHTSECWCIGTPNRDGKPKNDFYFNLMLSLRDTEPDWRGWHIPLPAKVHLDGLVPMLSPYAHPDFSFDRAKRGYAKAKRKKGWRIEWLCEFISDDGGQFEKDAIEAQCVLPAMLMRVPIKDTSRYAKSRPEVGQAFEGEFFEVYVLEGYVPKPESRWQLSIDVGVSDDHTCIGVLDLQTMEMVYFHDFLAFGQYRWFLVKEAIAMVIRRFSGRTLLDATGAGSNLPEAMQIEYGLYVEPFIWGMNKELVLNHTSELVEGEQIWLFDLEEIKLQLDIVQRTARASGRGFAIAAPKSSTKGVVYHDDVVTMLGQLTYEVIPPPPKSDRAGVRDEDYWSVGSTEGTAFAKQDDGSIVILDEESYHAYLSEYTG